MLSASLLGVPHDDFAVPAEPALADMTAELTRALGETDPLVRDEVALPVLATWIERGVYDDLLVGLGDGIGLGLLAGIGEVGTDSVFRRSFSALVLAECLVRDSQVLRVPRATVLRWGDSLATWFLREQDLRAWVPGSGWAHAVAHGADALGSLAGSPHLGPEELRVVLDVIGERATAAEGARWTGGEQDRLAAAVLAVLRRDLLSAEDVEAWLARVHAPAADTTPTPVVDEHHAAPLDDPLLRGANREAFWRALYLQLSLGSPAPAVRSNVLLMLVDVLRDSNPHHLAPRIAVQG